MAKIVVTISYNVSFNCKTFTGTNRYIQFMCFPSDVIWLGLLNYIPSIFFSVVFIRTYFHILFSILVNLVSPFRFVLQIYSGSIHSCSHTRLKSHYLWPCREDVCSSDPSGQDVFICAQKEPLLPLVLAINDISFYIMNKSSFMKIDYKPLSLFLCVMTHAI